MARPFLCVRHHAGHTCPPTRVPSPRTGKEPLSWILAGHLEPFLQQAGTAEHRLPLHVEKELRAYLECCILAVEGEDAPVFVPAPPVSDSDVQQIVETSARRIIRLCIRHGLLDDTAADPLTDEEPVLAVLTAASVRGVTATGARAGQRLRRVLKDPGTGVRTEPLCFASRGFSLHAATRIAGPDRRGLERLCPYVARPALAAGRLRILDADRLSFALKTPWSDGIGHLLLSPMELLEKLGALVPPPRFHLLSYHGVLAPRARDRGRIVPAEPAEGVYGGGPRVERCVLRPSAGLGGPAGAGVFLRP